MENTINLRRTSPTVVPNHIKSYRKGLGISQLELANHMGVTHAAVSYWESLERAVPDTSKVKLCKLFNCTITELFDWEA